MSSSFPFIPRSVAKPTPQRSSKIHTSSDSKPYVSPKREVDPRFRWKPTPNGTSREKDTALKDDELLTLIEISLSDYSCWCNPELQRRMKSTSDGYLPLKYLLTVSSAFVTLHCQPSEADMMRCIRSSPGSLLETRMLISEPSRSEWFNRGPGASTSYQSPSGGFEVRRKDWEILLQSLAEGGWNKGWWDHCTIYIERLPVSYRSIHAIARYIQSLLSNRDEAAPIMSVKIPVQSISFPSHHLAPPEESARCKGFAFIVLESPALVDTLCRCYPWEGTTKSGADGDGEASKFGIRVLPKMSWEKLKAEYFAHRQRLFSQVVEEDNIPQADMNVDTNEPPSKSDPSLDATSPPAETQSQPSWYPPNCLVFVRNIHPETNKTTLRALFSNLLSPPKSAVDYVDFNKGIDTCHLRLASPSDATKLVAHFTADPTAQHDALDQIGSAPTKERLNLELDIVQGKREELYWDKVPEKVRNAAVARLYCVEDQQSLGGDEGGQRRKRRKKG